MASFIARSAYSALGRKLSGRVLSQRRTIHFTPVAQKKKSKVVIDDLFADDPFAEEELIKATPAESPAAPQATKAAESSTPTSSVSKETVQAVAATKSKKAKLSPEVRVKRFEEQLKFMTEHLSDPSSAKAHVRKRSLLTLLDLAASAEQIKAVVNLLPKYKAAGIEPSPLFSEAFARRCQEVHCPLIALDVFGNFSKYNVCLSLDGARWLIHSLYVLYPLEKLMIATALFPVYSLPPISEDLPSATMVATACYKHGSPESIQLANKLRPFIQSMLRTQNIAKAKDVDAAKKNRWIAWSLHKLNKTFLKQTGKSYVSPRFIPKGFKIQIKLAVSQPKAAAA